MKLSDLTDAELLSAFREGLSWRVGPFTVRLTTSLEFVARQLGWLYAGFPRMGPGHCAGATISVRRSRCVPHRLNILVDGQPFYRWVGRNQVIPLLEWTFNLSVFHRPSPYLLVHAAVVEKGGRALVMPGAPGAGKSTLCAALVARGWRLLSDEVAVVCEGDARLLPVPRPISLKEESIARIREFAPEARLGPVWPGTAKGSIAHLLPPPASVRRMDEAVRAAWLVFPVFEPAAALELIPVDKPEAMMSCAEHAFNYSVRGRSGFLSLSQLLDDCECYFFSYGDLEAAVQMLEASFVTDPAHPRGTREPVR